MENSEIEQVAAQCALCGSTDTLASGDVIACKLCSVVLCWRCFPNHEHNCDCCGKLEQHVHAERCATCCKLMCQRCTYTHPCQFPFKAESRQLLFKRDVPEGSRENGNELDEFARKLELEEGARKLASELWAAILAMPEAGRYPILFEATLFAALHAIGHAQRAYRESELRQFVAVVSVQFATCLAVYLDSEPSDGDVVKQSSKVQGEFDRLLLLRYRQHRGETLGLWDRLYIRFYRVAFGERAWDEAYLKGILGEYLGRRDLGEFVRLLLTEINTIDSTFFGRL